MHLFTAGPAQSPKPILDSLSLPTLHHRSEEFKVLLNSCKTRLHSFVSLPYLFFLCSSGSGGMESVITSFNPRKILVFNHGKFSQRWLEIAHSFGIETHNFQIPPNQAHNPEEVLEILKKDTSIDCVCLQSCESTGGVRQNFESIAEKIKTYNPEILVCVDGIATLGIESIDVTHIDVFVASSQKALMLPVGLSFVFLSSYAFSLLDERKSKSFYFSLQNYRSNPIAFSLPSSLFQALHTSLSLIEPSKNYALIEQRFSALVGIFEHYRIALFASNPSKGIIAFKDRNEAIRSKLKAQKILISSGQGELKNHISRIGNFGILQEFEILLEALNEVLKTYKPIL